MKDQLFIIITVLASIAYFVPITIVLFKRLWRDRYFLLAAIYWVVGALANIMGFIPGVPPSTMETITVVYNMFDIPFILSILWYTTSSATIKKAIQIAIGVYIIVECILVFYHGIHYNSIRYILGIGVLMVLITLVWEITLYLQQIEHSNRERSMLFIYAALLFEYGSYSIVYIFEYFILAYNATDNLLIYYMSTLIAILIASCGFLIKKNNDPVTN